MRCRECDEREADYQIGRVPICKPCLMRWKGRRSDAEFELRDMDDSSVLLGIFWSLAITGGFVALVLAVRWALS